MTDDTTTTTTDLGGGWHRDGKYMTWTARDCGAIRLSDHRVRDDGTSILLIQARTVDLGHPDDPEPGWWAATVEVLPKALSLLLRLVYEAAAGCNILGDLARQEASESQAQ